MYTDLSNINLFELQEYYQQFNKTLEYSEAVEMKNESLDEQPDFYLNEKSNSIKTLITANIVTDKNIETRRLDKAYLTALEAEEVCQRILTSHCRINYRGQFTTDILKNGYKHWSLLQSTINTNAQNLFLQRLSSEFFIFGIKLYNPNIINKASNLFNENKESFIKEWNERFNTEFRIEIDNVEHLFIETGFTSTKEKYGVIFGCLYDDKGLIHTAEKVGQTYIEKTYGKSQIILKKQHLTNQTTFCLGDTFDAEPSSYAWKDNFISTLSKQFVLFDLSVKDNVYQRVRSLPKDSIPYIENHLFFQIQPKHIEKLIISKEELEAEFGDKFQEEIEKLKLAYKIPIEII